jgi:hypothetical protein
MLTIRNQQLSVFAEALRREFRARLAKHAERFFPEPCAALGKAGVAEVCEEAIGRAGTYGITAERDVAKFLSLMLIFGRRFDEDASLPWAGATLRQDGIGPTLRINRLYLAALAAAQDGRGALAEPVESA